MNQNWTRLRIEKFTDNYYLREQGLSIKKPYNNEYALMWDSHHKLAKTMLEWKKEKIQKEIIKRKRYY
jgi:hypothetical protein